MHKNASEPVLGGPKTNIKQFRGIADSVVNIKDIIERERSYNATKQDAFERLLHEREAECAAIQKDLSVQLRCAGRSYQTLLSANRDLAEQLRCEQEGRKKQVEGLEEQVNTLTAQLLTAAKPWKEEVSKRDLKIAKLQEAAEDQERYHREAVTSHKLQQEKLHVEVANGKSAIDTLAQENRDLRNEIKAAEDARDAQIEEVRQLAGEEAHDLRKRLDKAERAAQASAKTQQTVIQDLTARLDQLQRQFLHKERETEVADARIEQKEAGFEKMVQDFRIKQESDHETMQQLRTGYEATIAMMDKRIQDNEKEHQRRLKPWEDLVEKKDAEVKNLKQKMAELQKAESESRQREETMSGELHGQLSAAQGAVELAQQENYKLKRQLSRVQEELEDKAHGTKLMQMQIRLDEVTKKCEEMLRQKDADLQDKTSRLTQLQTRLLMDTQWKEKVEAEWDKRLEAKEEGYRQVVAQLNFAEGQIVEERGRTEAALTTVRKRERSIEKMRAEHKEELRVRRADHDQLIVRTRELEMIQDMQEADMETKNKKWEDLLNFQQTRQAERENSLHIEVAKREEETVEVEKQLQQVKTLFDQSRLSWEEKERELEIMMRGRDRAITALKNEIEFLNDSWEMKYNRLMGLLEKTQKKYDEAVGPNGVAETARRAKNLKEENEQLNRELMNLKETVKKQKKQIRDLQLDIDCTLKETADIIHDKDEGMAKILGENYKLENSVRALEEQMTQQRKELLAEKLALGESFQARVDQLEQLVESMRYTDRQELIDKIDVWKAAYGRIAVERDELEDEFQDLLNTKDRQLKGLAEENVQLMIEVKEEQVKAEASVLEWKDRLKQREASWMLEKKDLESKNQGLHVDLEKAKIEIEKLKVFDSGNLVYDDEEKKQLRREVAEKAKQIAALEKGVTVIVAENTDLRNETTNAKDRESGIMQKWEAEVKWRDERYNAMMKEHEALKKVLESEMNTAQDTCKDIQDEVRKLPTPFELELQELKDKYAQTQAGLQRMAKDNINLREELHDYKDAAKKEIAELQENLHLASQLLKDVASLDALKILGKRTDGSKA